MKKIVINGMEVKKGYEVKNAFFMQTLYFILWSDVVAFLSTTVGWDTTIKANVEIPDNAKEVEWKGVTNMWAL